MADDKGGSGGEWGTLEIVLGILLVIGFLNHLFGTGKPLFGDLSSAPREQAQDTSASMCGLTISRPVSLEKVTDFVTIVGSVGSCNWPLYGSTALYAQVVDSKGTPVSSYTAVTPSGINGDIVSFATTITLTAKPARGKGYVILVPARQKQAGTSISARIPITFSN